MSQCTVGQYGGSPGHLLTCSLLNLRGMEDRENWVQSLEAKHQKSATRSWSFFLSNGYQKKSVMTTWLTPRIGPQCSSDRRDNLIRLDIPASRTISPPHLFRLWIHFIISPAASKAFVTIILRKLGLSGQRINISSLIYRVSGWRGSGEVWADLVIFTWAGSM